MKKPCDVTISVMKGPMTAAYHKEENRWFCTALEFDIVGIGSTRKEALSEMQELVNAYLHHIINQRGRVALMNQSDMKATDDTEHYFVAIAVAEVKTKRSAPRVVEDVTALRRYRDRICGMNFLPAIDLVPTGA